MPYFLHHKLSEYVPNCQKHHKPHLVKHEAPINKTETVEEVLAQ